MTTMMMDRDAMGMTGMGAGMTAPAGMMGPTGTAPAGMGMMMVPKCTMTFANCEGGMMVCCCNLMMGMCKCEATDMGVRMTCTSGDKACCAMIQACCDCMMGMMKAGCNCCMMMNNMPVCCC